MHNNIHSVSLCFELLSIRQQFPHCIWYVKLFHEVTLIYTKL